MGGVRIVIASLALAGPLLVALATPAHACSCGGLAYAANELDLIVTGTVSDLRIAGTPPTLSATPEPGVTPIPETASVEVQWTFAVDEYIKGSGPTDLELHSNGHASIAPDGTVRITPGLGPDCSFAPEDGARYLFGVTTDGGKNFAGGCGSVLIDAEGEQYVAQVIADIRAALAGPEEFPDTGAGPPSDGGSPLPTIAVVALGIALAGGVLLSPLLFRRREP